MAEVSEQQPSHFPAVQQDEWRGVVEASLRGKSIEEKLAVHTSDGLFIQPLYGDRMAPSESIGVRSCASWARQENLCARDLGQALARMGQAARFGIGGFRLEQVEDAAEGELVARANELDVQLYFAKPVSAAGALRRIETGFSGGQTLDTNGPNDALIAAWRGSGKRSGLQVASSCQEQARGAGASLQVAICLWRGVAWLRKATAAGFSLEESASSIEWQLALGTDLFLEVAKLRAARLAWTKLLAASGLANASNLTPMHARTSERSWTLRDPWVNGLRGTTIAFAAAIGGVDSILVLPFDAMIGEPDEEALRLASNTHAILDEESHLGQVQDPAAGSGYVESLTGDIAEGAWVLFQELERLGADAQQYIEGEIEHSAGEEARAIATRRRGLIGVSEFPDLDEVLPQRTQRTHLSEVTRLAAPFEALRLKSDEHLAQTGQRPTAFLVNFGKQAEFRARSGFATNLLGAGGIAVLDNDGFTAVQEALAAYKQAGSPIAVIASTDENYGLYGPELARGLRELGAHVVMAGRPPAATTDGAASDVQHYIHLGCDALAVLSELQAKAGVCS